jgi:hypothetical protein
MKLHLLAAVVGLAMAAGAAQAQVGVYVTPLVSRISNKADTGPFAFLGEGKTSGIFTGAGFGVYDDFHHANGIDAGIDLRGDIMRGNGAHLNSFLVGPRVVFKPIKPFLRPYVEGFIGVGGSRAATNPATIKKFEYGVAGGLDYSFASHVDFRVIEIGYGAVPTVNSGVFAGNGTPPASHMINFSTGIVFRFK